jgi:hypothetical protein
LYSACIKPIQIITIDNSTMNMELACSAETPVSTCKAVQCHNPEDHNVNNHYSEHINTYRVAGNFYRDSEILSQSYNVRPGSSRAILTRKRALLVPSSIDPTSGPNFLLLLDILH